MRLLLLLALTLAAPIIAERHETRLDPEAAAAAQAWFRTREGLLDPRGENETLIAKKDSRTTFRERNGRFVLQSRLRHAKR